MDSQRHNAPADRIIFFHIPAEPLWRLYLGHDVHDYGGLYYH